jgi:hypothetical protein
MPEVLMTFEQPVSHYTGRYTARAIARRGDDGMWQGWLEFEPLDEQRPVIIGPVESTQPEREYVRYWATGLSPVFLEGALSRALSRPTVSVSVPEVSASDAPAPRTYRLRPRRATPEAVLDPFEVGGRNLDILRQELRALDRPRLLNIIAAYDLNPGGEDTDWMSDAQLTQFIVTATEVQMKRGRVQVLDPRVRGASIERADERNPVGGAKAL